MIPSRLISKVRNVNICNSLGDDVKINLNNFNTPGISSFACNVKNYVII